MNRPLVIAACLAAGLLGGTDHAAAQSLQETLVKAYQNNPTLRSQRARVRATDEQVSQALSGWRPNLSLNATTGGVASSSSVSSNQHQYRNPHSLGLSVSQPLYQGGRTQAAISSAENSVRAERARLDNVEQSVLLNAVTAYEDVVRDQAVLDLNINNQQVLRRQLEATRDRFEVGEVTRTDVNQAEARLAGATAARVRAQGNLVSSRATYRNVVGIMPGRLVAPPPPSDIPGSESLAITTATNNNPLVIAADYDLRSLQDSVDQVRGELLPSLALNGSASRNLNSSALGTSANSLAVTLQLSVPLYQSGSVYSRVRQARQLVAQQKDNLETARRNAAESATSGWENVQTVQAQIRSFTSQVQADVIALEGVQREAQVGSRTVLDVLDAEQELLDAKVNLVTAQRDLIVAVYQLKAALGSLTARQLKLPVDYYDPTRHYNEVRDEWYGLRSSGDGSGPAGQPANNKP